MKILFISMPSIHAIRWIENLKDSDHVLYWFDVLGKGSLKTEIDITQITDWKERKILYIKGEHFFRKEIPIVYEKIQPVLEVTANEYLKQILEKIKPDLVHSFEMQSCSYPIVKTMNKFPDIPWIYSCWGSDLYYYQNFSQHKKKIKKILQRVNYLQTDCRRDLEIAVKLGFVGNSLDIVPGGSGYKLDELKALKKPLASRKIILVKGYEHKFGRALNVVKALEVCRYILSEYEIVVFGAHPIVKNYIAEKNLNFRVFDRNELQQTEVLELMGKSIIYIGNSISDGMPNTLLEAIVMGAFPIQTNPGNVTEEIIISQVNGLMIKNPEGIDEISDHIKTAISNMQMIGSAFEINAKIAKERLEYYFNQKKVINIYNSIAKRNLCE